MILQRVECASGAGSSGLELEVGGVMGRHWSRADPAEICGKLQ
jgi:hypothetical protein